jgi:hypothetical protein
MNEIRCIFCEVESNSVVIEENGYKGRKCPRCGLIFISPRPSFDEIVALYGHDDAHISAKSHISAELSKRLYARHHLGIIRSFVKSGALLEIGAGAGYFLDEARRFGYSPHGLEFNPIQANYMRNKLGIPCEESPINTSIFFGKRFNIVYHCDVISHLFDPISDFRQMNEVMEDGAFLIFETGNLGEVDQKYFKYFQRFQYPDHLFFFSTGNLVSLLEKTGFDLVKIYRYAILPQLKAMNALAALAAIKNSVQDRATTDLHLEIGEPIEKEKHSSDGVGSDFEPVTDSQSLNTKALLKKSIRISYQYVDYALRYKIGRLVPKAKQPQTVIVVARKKK